jgi:putative phosphoserine phosphatase/1-acylglycerol-3-phosphate O-acyltransferase
MIAAFFDLDGTLATVHVWQALARHNWQQRVNRLALAGYMGTHYPQYLLYKLHLVSRDAAYTSWARDMPWLIGGLTLERAQTVFDWVADRQVIPSIRPDALTLLRQQQAQGRRVVLVSGTFQPLLETIGARLGVTECVGTRLKVSDDRYTGGATPPVCLGAGKAARLRQFLAEQGADIDLDASFAYGDGEWDVPILEMVGHPMAVYPEPGLLAQALRRGWPVFPAGA